ncbi:hypothetical protein PCAR4_210046 [Paraburkholderia caribensis]|nr:hypothetical protein PCAR4_210046 [Paraburkholderia caribensis]
MSGVEHEAFRFYASGHHPHAMAGRPHLMPARTDALGPKVMNGYFSTGPIKLVGTGSIANPCDRDNGASETTTGLHDGYRDLLGRYHCLRARYVCRT